MIGTTLFLKRYITYFLYNIPCVFKDEYLSKRNYMIKVFHPGFLQSKMFCTRMYMPACAGTHACTVNTHMQ